jgi:hypothetical protein
VAEVVAAGRHRQVGAQAQLGAGRVGEHVGAGPDLLAGPVEKHVGRLQDIGGNVGKAGGLEHLEDHRALGLERGALGRRLTGHQRRPPPRPSPTRGEGA